jgi:hypothetical protein
VVCLLRLFALDWGGNPRPEQDQEAKSGLVFIKNI